MTTRARAAQRFFQRLFDARLSDTIEHKLNRHHLGPHLPAAGTGATIRWRYLTRGKRMNPLRTLAIHHLNLQAKSLDDVTLATSGCRKMGYRNGQRHRPAPQRPPAVLLRGLAVGLEVEIRLEPDRRHRRAESRWQPSHYQGHEPVGPLPREPDAGPAWLGPDGREPGVVATRKEYTVGAQTHEHADAVSYDVIIVGLGRPA